MLCDVVPFDNNDVRLGMKYIVDREQLVKTVLRGYGAVGNDHYKGERFNELLIAARAELANKKRREMNNPLALCELAARAPNISAGHMVKQAWLSNDRVFILDFH